MLFFFFWAQNAYLHAIIKNQNFIVYIANRLECSPPIFNPLMLIIRYILIDAQHNDASRLQIHLLDGSEPLYVLVSQHHLWFHLDSLICFLSINFFNIKWFYPFPITFVQQRNNHMILAKRLCNWIVNTSMTIFFFTQIHFTIERNCFHYLTTSYFIPRSEEHTSELQS